MEAMGDRWVGPVETPRTTTTPLADLIAANQPKPQPITWAAYKAGVLGAVSFLSVVLAIRFILLVAVSGAIALSLLAMNLPRDLFSWVPPAIYTVTVVCPLIWLSSRR